MLRSVNGVVCVSSSRLFARKNPEFITNELQVKFTGELSKANDSVINMILSAQPEAAQYLNPGGSLPLSTFFMNVLSRPSLKDIESPMQVEPGALITRDKKTCFYPFMMAAIWSETPRTLDNVYTLLRANPMAVRIGMKDSRYEVYLKKNLAASNEKVEALMEENKKLSAAAAERERNHTQELAMLKKENERLHAELQRYKSGGCASKRRRSNSPPEDTKKARVESNKDDV